MRFLKHAFADLLIAKKLYVGFGAAIALLSVFAVAAIRDFNRLGNEFRIFSEMANESRLVSDVAGDVVNLQLRVREYLFTRNDEDAGHATEAFKNLIKDLAHAKASIQRPRLDRAIVGKQKDLLDEILRLTGDYGEGFDRVVELNKKRDLIVYQVLNPTGQKMRDALAALAESADGEQNYPSAKYAAISQEVLLGAQLSVSRFLGTNYPTDVRRTIEEFNRAEDALLPLEALLASPEHRRLLDAVKSDLSVYRKAFDELVGTIAERNRIRAEVFDKTGERIIKVAKAFEAETRTEMNALDANVVKAVREQLIESFVASVLAFVAAMSIAWIIGHGIGDPIRKMTRSMERLASGDTSVAIPGTGRADEVGSMAAAVQVFKESMNETERLREAERRALRSAETANRAKTEFLSNMSHELRTPMNAVMGFAQMLEMDRSLNPKQKESVQIIHKAGGHLLALINEVLDLAKVESGKLTLSIEDVSLAEQFDDCATLMGAMAKEKGIKLEFAAIDTGLSVRADRVRLKQTLVNLINNAIKYNRAQGSVRVTAAESEGGKVRIAVTDTGNGIPAERLTQLFRPFERLGADISGIEGTGIGLSLTKRLVEAMGGAIGVESTVGTGSTFSIVLPMATGARETVQDMARSGLVQHVVASGKEDTGAGVDVDATAATAMVIYVDDNSLNLKLVRQILGILPQVKLLESNSARHGLELIWIHQPDLILLDINLPEMNGMEMLARIRADPKTRATPVIAVSAAAMSEDIARAKAAGFDDYVTKPIDIQNFLAKVSGYLKIGPLSARRGRG